MKSDRELLEQAAKAAGVGIVWLESSHYGPAMARVEVRSGEGEITEPQNPLTDDGDAPRLAVKMELQLELDLRHSTNEVRVFGAPDGRAD